MTPEILDWLAMIRRECLPTPGRVLEIGAYNVNGSARQHFGDAAAYIGTDMQAGPGVDRVIENIELVKTFGYAQFDTVIACEVLEHDANCWLTVHQMRQMLKPGGWLVITTPTFGFPLHRYPKDYWRFGEDAYVEVFFAGMEIVTLNHLRSAAGPDTTLAGLARKIG